MIVVSDLHIMDDGGRSDKLLREIKRVGQELGETMVVLNGDIFEYHNPSLNCLLTFFEFIETCSMSVIINIGNHDLIDRANPAKTILHIFASERTTVVVKPLIVQSSRLGKAALVVPYTPSKKFIPLVKSQLEKAAQPIPILIAHQPINEGRMNMHGTKKTHDLSVAQIEELGFEQVILGDLHEQQYLNEDKTIFYTGTPISRKANDYNVKGLCVIKADGHYFVDLSEKIGQHVTYDLRDCEGDIAIPGYREFDINKIHCTPEQAEDIMYLYPSANVVVEREDSRWFREVEDIKDGDFVETINQFLKTKLIERNKRKKMTKLAEHFINKALEYRKSGG